MDAALATRLDLNPAFASGDGNLLRFITCGSVDDGKSTLIGRLLYESKTIFEDQLTTLEKDSKKHGTTGEEIDFALLVDGLEAEREQGITIDVAYRFFATPKRSFIVADTPGHEQYTRNMATGASTADLAIILIDARKGVLVQTKRHAFICSLLGVKNVVLAINKIDLMGYDEKVFQRVVADFSAFATNLGFKSILPIPLSARFGDNVTSRSANTPWYRGKSLIEHLEKRRGRRGSRIRAVPLPGAMGQPPEPRFPRLLRHPGLGPCPRRPGHHRRRFWAHHEGDTDRHRRRRSRDRRSGRCGDACAGRRGRCRARRRAERSERPAGSDRRAFGACDLDERDEARARAAPISCASARAGRRRR